MLGSLQLQELDKQTPCRANQLLLLNTFIASENIDLFPLNLLLIGKESGKTTLLSSFLKYYNNNLGRNTENLIYTWINCLNHISLKNFFNKTIKKIINTIVENNLNEQKISDFDFDFSNLNCDSANQFIIILEKICEIYKNSNKRIKNAKNINKPHIIIFENITEFIKLMSSNDSNDSSKNLLLILTKIFDISKIISSRFQFIFLITSFNLKINNNLLNDIIVNSNVSIYFKNYNKVEIFQILTNSKTGDKLVSDFVQNKNDNNQNVVVDKLFWENFIKIILESFHSFTGSRISLIISIIKKIWPVFIKGYKIEEKFNKKNFIQNFIQKRSIFNDNYMIAPPLVSSYNKMNKQNLEHKIQNGNENENKNIDIDIDTYNNDTNNTVNHDKDKNFLELSTFGKFILCASYIASFNPEKYDLLIFSKFKDLTKRKIYKRRKKNDVSDKDQLLKLLNPSNFPLERMLSILNSIYFGNFDFKTQSIGYITTQEINQVANIDFYSNFLNLISLNLIVVLNGNINDLDTSKLKFRSNIDHELAKEISNDIGFKIEDFLVDF
ncbi:origin recognition complex subunit 5 ASCRUDRAFT_85152 [Ascoidea rubescens DSM 1968]|uniref:Uncharacterized protein n=1 Tax=Ascoidea rubescens DSM 1968 TaxID=1344418 RepID=A0A1D2VLQ9_9ASCO|nr:hypothetical protein ASCRUDRAFT_85152 [Ascoidea rubescens DSM 1968]ODV62556.1 hypothetical protein ASCRUDRAFT_85152 [Ascoidea rubescens DSM 1968]